MKVSILDAQRGENGWRVRFSSPYGTASATWFGGQPKIGSSPIVEMDCDECEILEQNPQPESFSISNAHDSQSVIVTGRIEMLTEEGTLILRIGDDVMQCECTNSALVVGRWVCLRTPHLQLHDPNY
jgi:hypothetical protein